MYATKNLSFGGDSYCENINVQLTRSNTIVKYYYQMFSGRDSEML